MLKSKFIFLCAIMAVTQLANAQFYMSPFSRHAIGDIQPDAFVRHRGMGGASIASIGDNMFSLANPATYSLMRSFGVETGFSASYNIVKADTQRYRFPDYKFTYLSMALPLDSTSQWGFSLGLVPYSQTGYKTHYSGGTGIKTDEYFSVEGQLTKFYAGSSINVFPKFRNIKDSTGKLIKRVKRTTGLFVGGNAAYVFGNTKLAHTINFPDTGTFFSMRKTTSSYIGDFMFDIGTLFRFRVDSTYFSIGGTYQLPASLKTRQSAHVISMFNGTPIDSIQNTDAVAGTTSLPMAAGAGLNINIRDSWQIAFDARYRKWTGYSTSFGAGSDSLRNSLRFNIGGQWIPGSGITANKFAQYVGSIRYRLGFGYEQRHYVVNGNVPTDARLTFGMGFPIPPPRYIRNSSAEVKKRSFSYLDFAVELGQIGNLEKNGIHHQYIIFSLGLHVFEPDWFERAKIE